MKKYKYRESGRAVKFGDKIAITFENFLGDKTVKVTNFDTLFPKRTLQKYLKNLKDNI